MPYEIVPLKLGNAHRHMRHSNPHALGELPLIKPWLIPNGFENALKDRFHACTFLAR
jgi:hypothetical protein